MHACCHTIRRTWALGPYMYAVEIHIVGGPKTNTAKSNYFSLQKFPDFLKFVTNYTVAI